MSQSVFIPSTSKNSGGAATQEDVEFVFWRNPKNGNEFKLLNLENDELAPRYGIVELKPVKVSNRHENNAGFKLLNDVKRECFIGIPISWDAKTGEPIWRKITLSNHDTYDLSIKSQRQEWIMVKNSPYFTDVVGGVEQNHNFDSNMKARYKATDKEREDREYMMSQVVKRSATDIAEALADDNKQLEEIALSCGLDPKSMSALRLHAQVFRYAEQNPKDFLKIYKSDSRTELATLRKGVLTGVLTSSLSEGVSFNGLSLGHNDEQCVSFLKEHPQTLAAIDSLSRQKDKGTLESNSITKGTVTEQNAKELAQAKRIRELEAQLAATSGTKVEELSEVILDKVDPEFAGLLAEAKRLNIKGAHLVKDKEKLRDKVDEALKLKGN